jgi:predicted dehydrogenase
MNKIPRKDRATVRSMSVSRRTFVAGAVALAGAPLWAQVAAPNRKAANEKVNVAVVGAGGRGADNINDLKNTPVNIVALCDCDSRNAAATFEKYPDAKRYSDWRRMLEQEKGIDAVLVATPDHNHACIAIASMKLGKHVYSEKPLTRTIWEAREMARVAGETGVATQMGTQGHAFEGTRRAVEVIRAGAIGDVKEIHVWTDRPANWWPQGVARPTETPDVPKGLDWDVWLGPSRFRPYSPAYVPFKWRGFWDFGTGAIGDMGIHNFDTAYWALDLGLPARVEVQDCSPGLEDETMAETAPKWCIIDLHFAARGDQPAVKVTWYDGGKLPPQDLFYGEKLITRDGGSLIIGSKGTLFTRTWHGGDNDKNMFLLLPKKEFADYKVPAPTLPRTASHHHEWVAACRGEGKTQSPFSYAAKLTESLLVGNLALRAGGTIDWGGGRIDPKLEAFVKPEFRPGWF